MSTTLRGSRNEKETSVRLWLRPRRHGGIFLCAASMPLVAGAVFLGRPRARMILLKPVEMHIGTQSPQDMKMKKNLEMIGFLLHQVPLMQLNHQQKICSLL